MKASTLEGRILIVEDEGIVAMDIERGLKRLGYKVVGRASRGEEAIRHAEELSPNLVLMDVRLKGQMNGIDAAHEIRKRFNIPIIFLTAYADEGTLERAKHAEPYGYLLKPFDDQELHTAIEVALHKHNAVATTQARAEEALRQAEQQLKLFTESVRDYSICMLDCSGRVLTWNPGSQRLKGYTAQEVVGKHISIFYTTEDLQSDAPQTALRVAEREGQYQTEGWRVRKDGTRFWADVHLTAIHDPAGKLQGFGKVTRDITSRKLAREQIEQLNADLEKRVRERTSQLEAANKEMEAFSYSVSHDLRAPLRGIHGYVRILLEDYSKQLDGEGQRLLGVVSGEAKRMGQLVDDLLAFSRLGRQELKLRRIDMTVLARETFADLSREGPAVMANFELKQMPAAYGDPAMLRQVFINLLANAIKFSRTQPAPAIEVGSCESGGKTSFYVKDNGVGFDEKYGHKLFGVFQRLHSEEEFEGTGVGLALVQRIIGRHGGKVWAEGKPNQGAIFHFTLPLSKGEENGSPH